MRAHDIASDFDRAGLALAGIAAGFIQDAQQRQADADYEQSLRNVSAAGRAMQAVTRQRAALQASVDEAAALRAEVARLQQALVASRQETVTARQQLAAQQQETVRVKRLLRGAVGFRAA
ncbi:response regulator receiver protein [Methylobacterium brachiatum]|jgi:hypothetical protein|uniref:response regulator receiver protein n=1 Tax=Methylobacterium brachiatum TaxID=269660 RepID=UPI000EFC6A3F|nr:response regulator receiver protein [Methylobacterium brachiatum]AYO83123.1 response regulator receiver protein [Methylobacterium brachiatum]